MFKRSVKICDFFSIKCSRCIYVSMYIDAHKYVALRTPGIFISWIRVYKFIYLLIQTDDVFVSKQNRNPYQFTRAKKAQLLIVFQMKPCRWPLDLLTLKQVRQTIWIFRSSCFFILIDKRMSGLLWSNILAVYKAINHHGPLHN